MNIIKKATNSQLSTTESKKIQKQKETKQTSRTGTESQKWRSHGELSTGECRGREEEKVQRISSINGR